MSKEKKLKVPKRIAGVKVPKKARKTANKALAMAEDPMVRHIAIAALTAAAAALAEKKVEVPTDLGEQAPKGASLKLGDLIAVAALEGARRLLDKAAPPAKAAAAPGAARTSISSNGAATGNV